jgi:3-dehydroquinate dehydratase-2
VFRQSNVEGELVTWIQQAKGRFNAIILNAAAYTHTAWRFETHLGDGHPYRRSASFQHPRPGIIPAKSLIAPVCRGQISGFGANSYVLAVRRSH